jgi:hypothetical protein
MMTAMNDLMDALHGDLKLAGQGLQSLASGIPSTNEIVSLFLGEWFFRRLASRIQKLQNECGSQRRAI